MSFAKPVVWIDITNAPHVRFFSPLIRQWSRQVDCHITTRDHSNTIALLRSVGLPYTRIGGHGAGRLTKPLAFWIRVLLLARHVRQLRPAVGIGQSSFHLPVAGALARIPTLYTNDNEYAKGNRLAFRYAGRVLVPEPFPENMIPPHLRSRVRRYPGIKEGIYLARDWQRLWTARRQERRTRRSAPRIYVRPEPVGAQYYREQDDHLRHLLQELSGPIEVHVMPRSACQASTLSRWCGEQVRIRRDVVTLEEMAARCTLFVSAGGTMGREAALLGIPVVSVYKKELLAVDRWLVQKGLLVHDPRATAFRLLSLVREDPWDFAAAEDLARKGHEAIDLVTGELRALGLRMESPNA